MGADKETCVRPVSLFVSSCFIALPSTALLKYTQRNQVVCQGKLPKYNLMSKQVITAHHSQDERKCEHGGEHE